MGYVRRFGDIPGNPEGTIYPDREAVRIAGLHAHKQNGISGTATEGADAIVLSGGYTDDQDRGEVIVYTGHGGQNGSRRQVADQSFAEPGNAGLVKSEIKSFPIRIIRRNGKVSATRNAPVAGYRYDGLYRVVSHWYSRGKDGYNVCQFLLVKLSEYPLETGFEERDFDDLSVELGSLASEPPSRVERTLSRINRRAQVVNNIKRWHENHCQICGGTVMLPKGPVSEAAHIRPLGVPHNGPDAEANVLCLCPNDHRRFDNGAFYLTDNLYVFDTISKTTVSKLKTNREHTIDITHVQYHRDYWK